MSRISAPLSQRNFSGCIKSPFIYKLIKLIEAKLQQYAGIMVFIVELFYQCDFSYLQENFLRIQQRFSATFEEINEVKLSMVIGVHNRITIRVK
jgi:hypothetical protein